MNAIGMKVETKTVEKRTINEFRTPPSITKSSEYRVIIEKSDFLVQADLFGVDKRTSR